MPALKHISRDEVKALPGWPASVEDVMRWSKIEKFSSTHMPLLPIEHHSAAIRLAKDYAATHCVHCKHLSGAPYYSLIRHHPPSERSKA